MRVSPARCVAVIVLLIGSAAPWVYGQTDDMIDTLRTRTDIGVSDQNGIRLWINNEISGFESFKPFRERFLSQFQNPKNSAQFMAQFASLTAEVAARQFGSNALSPDVAHGLAQVLVDMNRVETHPALLACLASKDARARYLCAEGLVNLRRQVASDNNLLTPTIEALRSAGLQETSGVVLGRIYDALAMPDKLGSVFDAYMAIFDARLAVRRQSPGINQGPELYAFEFFRLPEVRSALDQNQKSQLVSRLAVFLRLDAERYNAPNLSFDEIDRLERMLDANEEILAALAGDVGGKIRATLSSGGYEARSAVAGEVAKWVGDASGGSTGALNQAPWNVPAGAP